MLILAAMFAGCRQELTVDMSKTVTDTNAAPVDLAAAVAQAKRASTNCSSWNLEAQTPARPVWPFSKHVFSTPEFAAYAKSNLIFVRLDYPLKVKLRPETEATNDLLAHQFDAYAFSNLRCSG